MSRLSRQIAALWAFPASDIKWWMAVALALAAAGASFLLHSAVEPFFQPDRGLIVFIPAVVLVTLLAGPRYGVLTAAVSGIAVWYIALPPVYQLTLSHADIVSLCIYVFCSAIAILLVHWLRQSRLQERLLRRELQHRTKNLFALVHGLAHQTLRGDALLEQARNSFVSRLTALNRANETMEASGNDRIDLNFLVRSVLKSFSDRFECHGKEAYVNGQTARNLSLALHELATNCTKYGAFSSPNGSVEVTWETSDPKGYSTFVWREAGGPPVSPPTRTGFGSKLLRTVFGRGEVAFARDGLVFRVKIPLAA